MTTSSPRLFPPGSDIGDVPYAHLLGTWHVVASTLPLWKNKKNVRITYSAVPDEPATTFDDHESTGWKTGRRRAGNGALASIFPAPEAEILAVRRGKGLLMIASSRWQLLGFHVSPSSTEAQSDEPEWAVTYFASTLFTPAGLDIYSRTKDGLSDAFVEALIADIGALGGEVASMIKDGRMFRVPHD
ncbi:hypothetical protein C8J57DRAFT_1491095 [Mycena rebaudengoi]|nr:hypothetical protein C8J57DRAFT_1491095 [Mycena rebaudengoi]